MVRIVGLRPLRFAVDGAMELAFVRLMGHRFVAWNGLTVEMAQVAVAVVGHNVGRQWPVAFGLCQQAKLKHWKMSIPSAFVSPFD